MNKQQNHPDTKANPGAVLSIAQLALGILLVSFLAQSATATPISARSKGAQNVTVRPLGNIPPQKIVASQSSSVAAPSLRLAAQGDRCDGNLGGPVVCAIRGWVIGNEIYKAYQDPSINCSGAYPFTIDTAHILLGFTPDPGVIFPLTIPVSIDIEAADTTTTPGCPLPGATLFSSSQNLLTIPFAGDFEFLVALDAPFEVTGPYFVGFIFNDTILPEWGVEIATDDIEKFCVTYNFWDTAIGFVDLGDDIAIHHESFPDTVPCFNAPPDPGPCQVGKPCFDFDGRLKLWSNGVTGGVSVIPAPGIAILGPGKNEKLYGSTDIWVAETTASPIIDSAVFYQRSDITSWIRIGVDVNPDVALGRGAGLGAGQGLSYLWDFSAESEATHWIKVEIYDSLLQTAIDSVSVFLEPTPPVPVLNSPSYFSRFCDTLTLTYDILDEDPTSVLLLKKQADPQYSQGLETQFQFALGDVDGDTADGNPASRGEFGDFFGGPSVGALALRYWHGKGFIQSLVVVGGGGTLTNAEAAERLAMFMNVRLNGALSDENFVLGFRQYLLLTGFGELQLEFRRQASYATLRNWSEDFGVCAMIRIAGVTGSAGRWFAVDGYDGLPVSGNTNRVRVSDPSDGTIKTLLWRDSPAGAELFYQSAWFAVDIIAGLIPSSWVISGRTGIGLEFSPGSQSTFLLDSTANGLTDGALYFITAQLTDQNSNQGESTTLLELNCASFAIGDYDGNDSSDVADLSYLIAFQVLSGPSPAGGAIRADVNCDGNIDTADLIYYLNWIFVGGPAPCQ